jgi:hypothetical protein
MFSELDEKREASLPSQNKNLGSVKIFNYDYGNMMFHLISVQNVMCSHLYL